MGTIWEQPHLNHHTKHEPPNGMDEWKASAVLHRAKHLAELGEQFTIRDLTEPFGGFDHPTHNGLITGRLVNAGLIARTGGYEDVPDEDGRLRPVRLYAGTDKLLNLDVANGPHTPADARGTAGATGAQVERKAL